MPTPCPCDPLRDFTTCCGPLLAGERSAPDAEALMRSRYTAYVRGDAAYLLATWHPDTRPTTLEFDPGVRWLGLDVKRHAPGDGTTAVVEFVARYRVGGERAVRLHEISRFQCMDGDWLYVDGRFPSG
ncbi:YchJ family protein [Marilutibacter aestuarii]|uniref:UPF0225 protein FKV25_01645 n=1 Tax=Marilutibacter aestuarii TaxID=1706195 RepID=A0A508AZK2_9GAMM|nr:YchJ family metal-binding protein [Lysobacter aestuarii]TQD51322.1 hypothetical protein FKV25_01645 [Lysobacter aestuarii]